MVARIALGATAALVVVTAAQGKTRPLSETYLRGYAKLAPKAAAFRARHEVMLGTRLGEDDAAYADYAAAFEETVGFELEKFHKLEAYLKPYGEAWQAREALKAPPPSNLPASFAETMKMVQQRLVAKVSEADWALLAKYRAQLAPTGLLGEVEVTAEDVERLVAAGADAYREAHQIDLAVAGLEGPDQVREVRKRSVPFSERYGMSYSEFQRLQLLVSKAVLLVPADHGPGSPADALRDEDGNLPPVPPKVAAAMAAFEDTVDASAAEKALVRTHAPQLRQLQDFQLRAVTGGAPLGR